MGLPSAVGHTGEHDEALRLLRDAVTDSPGRPEEGEKKTDNVSNSSGHGNSKDYTLDQLAREAPELYTGAERAVFRQCPPTVRECPPAVRDFGSSVRTCPVTVRECPAALRQSAASFTGGIGADTRRNWGHRITAIL